ncbi:Dihydrodipicolinate synthase [uncultured Clostridium sp.]|uniref:Dihydrodipicolinate synthase family protein n=1 Tax=Muricoprocola aceti TaxID=2981772 RepID=A0ABT2SIT0_9FIRM|nr:dihydrodipicolinate synthase family protein [Muricoprocola aceti]MCU6724422.1 dihydrodipicolinate synthase family protein [Muricoprocola aceti]SCH12034.1 Dihydrodipicolinate synthase [uncultured Clostridium sp.]
MSKKIAGIIPPIVTPFDPDGSINLKLAEKEMKICLDAGVHGISVGGSTGEGPTLRDEELVELIGVAKKLLKEEQSLVCGVMRTCTRDAVRAGLAAKEAGADAIMVTPPAYNVLVPNEQGMFDYYSTISKEVQLPIIIYNVIPQNTILPGLFKRLVDETEYVRGVKQSVGSVPALYAMKMAVGDKGDVYAATDDMLYTCYELGASGAISAILSVFPKECVDMFNYQQNGEKEKAFAIQNALYNKWQCLGGNQFPIRLKYALEVLGREPGLCRSPITYLPDDEKAKIRAAFME